MTDFRTSARSVVKLPRDPIGALAALVDAGLTAYHARGRAVPLCTREARAS